MSSNSINRQLSNGEYLIVEFRHIVNITEYKAYVEDTQNMNLIDFEGYKGILSEYQTKDELADQLMIYCNSIL